MTLRGRLVVLTITIVLAGCEPPDERLVDFAEQANEQQARQSEQVARQGKELASAARELVEQDAAARRELIVAQAHNQDHFREQQAVIDEQRQQLHVERRETARAAAREPVIAQAVIAIGLILAALLPLIVTAYALRRLPDANSAEGMLADALLEDMAALPVDATSALPPQPRLAASPPPGLPSRSE